MAKVNNQTDNRVRLIVTATIAQMSALLATLSEHGISAQTVTDGAIDVPDVADTDEQPEAVPAKRSGWVARANADNNQRANVGRTRGGQIPSVLYAFTKRRTRASLRNLDLPERLALVRDALLKREPLSARELMSATKRTKKQIENDVQALRTAGIIHSVPNTRGR